MTAPGYPDAAILVTGASGFVGKAVMRQLESDGREVYAASRSQELAPGVRRSPDLSNAADWSVALRGIDVVVHTAARVHIMNDNAVDPLAVFREMNVAGTLTLARQAALAGVRRFIFISSIKVNGEATGPGIAFAPRDMPAPIDFYGISKAEAEMGLQQIARDTGMEVIVIRPPLVYGPGVKANFNSMMKWVHRGLPLPFGSIRNKRSLVALGNLVDLIVVCIDHSAAANRIFLVSDGVDLSTPELLRKVADALDTTARLIPVPPGLLALSANLIGKPAIARRLCDSLQVDISETRNVLGWQPPVTIDAGLRLTAEWFLSKIS